VWERRRKLRTRGKVDAVIICNKILCDCGPCSKVSPKSLVNDDFNAYEDNVPATLFLDLTVAISVYFALFSRHLIGRNAAGSHGVLIGAHQALFWLPIKRGFTFTT
jgi:hypothetical protein